MNDSFSLRLKNAEVEICPDLRMYKCLPDSFTQWHAAVIPVIKLYHLLISSSLCIYIEIDSHLVIV